MKCHGPLRRPRPLFVSVLLLALALCLPAAASASSVVVSSGTAAGAFYSWCGGKTLLAGLLPDAVPPASPTSCGDYSGAGSSGTLTGQFATHDAGTFVASVFIHVDSRPATLTLDVGGAQAGAAITAPQSHSGWVSFPATSVSASATISVQVRSGPTGSGYVRVYSVHGDLTPPVTTPATPPPTTLGQPGNWATTPIPSGVALATGAAPNGTPLTTAVPLELAGQAAAASWVNRTSFTTQIDYVPVNTPLQPVRLCRYSGECIPNWGSPTYDLWRAAMGEGNAATFNATTGKPVSDQYIGGGIPITSTVTASPGSDREAVICRGGGDSGTPPWVAQNTDGTPFTRLDGQLIEGSCWELFGLAPDPTYDSSLPISPSNTAWMIEWGARRTGFIAQLGSGSVSTTDPLDTLSGTYARPVDPSWYGPDVATPGAPNSTTFDTIWGVTSARTPLLTDVVSQSDCRAVQSGAADFGHAVGIQLQGTRNPMTGAGGTPWWPAGSSDGTSPGVATTEGMRVFFQSNIPMPSGLSVAAQALFHTLQRYGAVVDDTTGGGPALSYATDGSYQSGGALGIRSELDLTGTGACTKLGVSSALTGIPWAQITGPIAMGSDSNPNPAS